MFSKQNLLATLAATVVSFLLGYAIWGFALADFFDGHTLTKMLKDPPDMVWLVIANLVSAFAVSTIYGKWARGHHSAGEGFKLGFWIGVFMLGVALIWYSTAEFMDLTGHLVDGIASIVFWGVVGAVIGMVYKATAAKESS